VQVRYAISTVRRLEEAVTQRKYRMGWRVQVTNTPVEHLALGQAVRDYRGGWCLERDFHLMKDRPLGISPLQVRLEDQIEGLTRLLTLGLRLLSVFETQVRWGQAEEGEPLAGLYPGQAKRTSERPTASASRLSHMPAMISVSATSESVPTESRSNCVNSRKRPLSGLSARQTGETW